VRGNQATWFAVYTKPRQERIARDHLARQGFHCFLPEAHNPFQRRTSVRQPRVEALFPRYLFLSAIPQVQDLAVVRSTRGVTGLVRSGHEPLRVPEAIISELETRLDPETGLVRMEPIPLKQGDRVRVFDGPLSGFEGILEAGSGERRTMVLMELLGRLSRVEVDGLLLQRAG
jgi:transcriptional antiterminator RfaH